MARSYYPPDNMVVAAGGGSPAALTLAPSAEFRVYSAETGGTEYTDLLASDGVSALPLNGNSRPFCDSNGIPPGLYGPNNVNTVLWRDLGGSKRFPMYPSTDIAGVLVNGVRTNVANTFTAAQSFTGAVTMSTTPTVAGQTVVTAANLAAQMAVVSNLVAFLNASGQPYTVYVNPSTGVWPNGGARVHMSGVAMTGFTGQWIWDSMSFAGASEASGRTDGDIWDERVA
jgi:hypothetical protein